MIIKITFTKGDSNNLDIMDQDISAQYAKRMAELNELLKYHSKRYHQDDQPEITDFEYDLLFNELRQLEEDFPHLKLKDSITAEVGYTPKRGFTPFTHPMLMGSLDNAMNFEELKKFIDKRNQDLNTTVNEYFLSLKLDGLALELIYQQGKLIVAATRGDGTVGENITKNALWVKNVPKVLKVSETNARAFPPTLVIRGEVIMTNSFLNELNQQMQNQGEEPFANPRNAAAGTMRQLDQEIVKNRKLFFYPYGLANWEECNVFFKQNGLPVLPSHDQQLNYLSELGFTLNPHYLLSKNYSEIENFCNTMLEKRNSFDFEIDGVVLKINSGALQRQLGEAGRRPRYAIAWKLPPDIKETLIKGVVFQVGRTGKVTPVAILEPVTIGGAVVRRATLHNFNEIKEKDLHIGDWVKIIRSGDVIPKILGVITEKRSDGLTQIDFPTHCPICNSILETEKSGLLTFCKNSLCGSKQYFNIVHFASKDAMNIEGLGKEFINELIKGGKLNDVSDLYILKDEDFDVFKRVGEKLKTNLLNSINESRTPSLQKFIYALGIPGVGEKTAKMLARKFGTLETLISQPKEILIDINEIGEIIAEKIFTYFSDPVHKRLIEKLVQNGVNVLPYREQSAVKNRQLNNKKILFTGTLSMPRNRAKELAEEAGAEIISSVSKQLDYLVVGENPGSKRKKAEELHIKILTEEDFLNLTNE